MSRREAAMRRLITKLSTHLATPLRGGRPFAEVSFDENSAFAKTSFDKLSATLFYITVTSTLAALAGPIENKRQARVWLDAAFLTQFFLRSIDDVVRRT